MAAIKTPLPEDITALIQARIENRRRVDAIGMRLFEGTGEAPQEWIDGVHLGNRIPKALEARAAEAGPVVERLLAKDPEPVAGGVLRF